MLILKTIILVVLVSSASTSDQTNQVRNKLRAVSELFQSCFRAVSDFYFNLILLAILHKLQQVNEIVFSKVLLR